MSSQIKEEGLTNAYLLGKYDGIKQGRADAKKEINEIMDMDLPISNILYEINKWLKEQK